MYNKKLNRLLLSLTFGLSLMQIGTVQADGITEQRICYFQNAAYKARHPGPVVYWIVKDKSLKIKMKGDVSLTYTNLDGGTLNTAKLEGTILIPHHIRKWCQTTTRAWTISEAPNKEKISDGSVKYFVLNSEAKAGVFKRTPVDLDCSIPNTEEEKTLLKGLDPDNAVSEQTAICLSKEQITNINELYYTLTGEPNDQCQKRDNVQKNPKECWLEAE